MRNVDISGALFLDKAECLIISGVWSLPFCHRPLFLVVILLSRPVEFTFEFVFELRRDGI